MEREKDDEAPIVTRPRSVCTHCGERRHNGGLKYFLRGGLGVCETCAPATLRTRQLEAQP